MCPVEDAIVVLPCFEVLQIIRSAWVDHVVSHHHRALLDDAVALQQLEVRHVKILPVVDEDEIYLLQTHQELLLGLNRTHVDVNSLC